MRNLQECQAEVFRRSEQRIQKRKKRRNHILMVCVPLVLCLTTLGGVFLSHRSGKSTDCAAPEAFYAASGEVMANGSGTFAGSVEISGNGLSHVYTSVEDVQSIIEFIDTIKKAPEAGTLYGSIDIIADQSTSITFQDDCSLGGYKILIRYSDGTSTEYSFLGSSLTDQTTQETFRMREDTYFALKDLLGIPFY